jgi:hypothetical protein
VDFGVLMFITDLALSAMDFTRCAEVMRSFR